MSVLPYYPHPKNQKERSANLAHCEHHDVECCVGCFRKVLNIRWRTPVNHMSRFIGGAWYEEGNGQYCAECAMEALRTTAAPALTERTVITDEQFGSSAQKREPIRRDKFLTFVTPTQRDVEETQRKTVRVELCFLGGQSVVARMPGTVGLGTKMQLHFSGNMQFPLDGGWYEVKEVKHVGLLERLSKSGVQTRFVLSRLPSFVPDLSRGCPAFIIPVR